MTIMAVTQNMSSRAKRVQVHVSLQFKPVALQIVMEVTLRGLIRKEGHFALSYKSVVKTVLLRLPILTMRANLCSTDRARHGL